MTDDQARRTGDRRCTARTAGGGGAANAVQDHRESGRRGVRRRRRRRPGRRSRTRSWSPTTSPSGSAVSIAVDVDHLEIQRGAITALIGPNGAGKTTFFNLLTGFDKPNAGKVAFDGEDISGVPPYRLANQGMVRTFQLTKALSRMTVIDNMKLGATDQVGENFWKALLADLGRPGAARSRHGPTHCSTGST